MKPNAGARKVSNHNIPGDAEAECENRNNEAQRVGVSGNDNSQASFDGTIDEYWLDQVTMLTIEMQTNLRLDGGLAN